MSGKIRIVRKADKKDTYKEKSNKVFILGLVDRYNIPKGKKIKQFEKELYKISNLLDQSRKHVKYKDYLVRITDYIYGSGDVKPLIKIVYSKNQILILYTDEFSNVRHKIGKGEILNIITPALSIMRNKRKISNFIVMG